MASRSFTFTGEPTKAAKNCPDAIEPYLCKHVHYDIYHNKHQRQQRLDLRIPKEEDLRLDMQIMNQAISFQNFIRSRLKTAIECVNANIGQYWHQIKNPIFRRVNVPK
jgi:hypothetical protein